MHHNRVRKVDGKTRIITTVAGTGAFGPGGDDGPATAARLAGPAGITLVPEANGKVTLFIADYYNAFIRAVGPDGIIRNVAGEGSLVLGSPSRVAFEPRRGWLYVADSSNNRIQKFDATGTFIAAWGVSGTGNGQFAGPTAVATDVSGNVYVTDQGNDRIQKFACP